MLALLLLCFAYLLAWFATALFSMGSRLGSPPAIFMGQGPPIKIMGESFYLRALLCFAKLHCFFALLTRLLALLCYSYYSDLLCFA